MFETMTQDLRISARQLQMFIDESPDQIQFKAGHPWPSIDGLFSSFATCMGTDWGISSSFKNPDLLGSIVDRGAAQLYGF